MTYYLKKLGHQELGSISTPGSKPSRGRYIYISKDDRVLSFFPPLSKQVKNDSSLLPIIPLYLPTPEKVYCNYIYHNDKYNGSLAASPRNEFRIYSNNALEMDQFLFEPDDIIVMKKQEILEAEEKQTVYFLERVTVRENYDFYKKCEGIIDDSDVRSNHGIYEGSLEEIDNKIDSISTISLRAAIDTSVTKKIETSDTDIADLFSPTSFRDFTMTAYKERCAVTGMVIKYGKFMNLEAAHIHPKSHGGLFLPNNGLALSRDIHWSFDKGFFTLNDDYTLLVHPDVESDFLKSYNGQQIFIPENDFLKPSTESIEYHRENVYGLFLTSGRL
ncbi:HNH endonuclease [Aquibacillus rhizosphaerae]|uniref:HNH endonuclease n=1 Tax=Aquibacillus rhizosphaerae TaxID=3051431 RepID=A0ABT7L9D9_9BACI|nr:HNH endonuclease [Aquibacillus sp. LR5S19]MDL4842484.1 HNH endonuclease [Aquibacillus sp. LR5S19]